MRTRTVVAIALSVGVTVLAATSVNYASASSSAPKSAPSVQDADAAAPLGGDGQTNFDYQQGDRDRGRGQRGDDDDRGRIHVNERTFSPEEGVCTAVISSPATSFNVRNDSEKAIEFFRGITCDNGAAIATIGPGNSSSAIPGTPVLDGATVPFALVGSFRAIEEDHKRHH
ncbi:hypothetical protein [Streptomyces bicolor]|uniref:hypothetical protein n=1 Tax=Streptomyces bicolor TaxID=66874 RepID=UPI000996C0E7|nr:hypothetical protein [Streptomyces bicolor]